MTGPSGGSQAGKPGDSWERRATDLVSEVQRWLIRSSARNLRDEVTDQVRKVFRAEETTDPKAVWERAVNEPPPGPGEPPECAWCPICRAARMVAESRRAGAQSPAPSAEAPANGASGSGAAAGGTGAASAVADAAEAMIGAVREALTGLDSLLSYRPPRSATGASDTGDDAAGRASASDDMAGERAEGHEGEPDNRG